MPKSIIKNLEKGKLLLNGMKDKEKNKLNSFVNDCINIVKILKIILKVLI